MSEQRRNEITVGTAVVEWGEEMVAQWNVLGDTIARSVQQRTKLEQEHGQQEHVTHAAEMERMRTALAERDARATAIARESAARLDATRREYETKLSLLQQELEQRGRAYEQPLFTSETASVQAQSNVADRVESDWEEETPRATWQSALTGIGSTIRERWERLRSAPYLMPATGFLAGLAVMVSLYPLLHRPSAAAAKESTSVTRTAEPVQGTSASQANANPAVVEPGPATADETAAASTPITPVPEGYAVLLAGGRLLTPDKPGDPSAVYEARLALRAGYTTTSVYRKNDRYMTAVLFSNRQEAEKSLQSINADFENRWKSTSSIVPVGEWCRSRAALGPVVVNGTEVAVWSCNKASN